MADTERRERGRRRRAPADSPPLTDQERRSLTRSELRLADGERRTYGDALAALNDAGIPFVLSGLFSVYAYTGISRRTEDLDLLLEPRHVVPAARALSDAGFETVLEERHWLAKAHRDDRVVDLVFGMSNGLWSIDEMWHRRGVEGRLCDEPVRIAAPEDLIFHRLFITERHRFDMADIVHLVLVRGEHLDWRWLLDRVGEHWRLLFAQILFFEFSYPQRRGLIPSWVREELQDRLRTSTGRGPGATGRGPGAEDREATPEEERPRWTGGDAGGPADENDREPAASEPVLPVNAAGSEDAPPSCMGTLISRFSFAVDVNEWGFRDRRSEAVRAARSRPEIREIGAADVWDVRRDDGAATPHPPDADEEAGGGSGSDAPKDPPDDRPDPEEAP